MTSIELFLNQTQQVGPLQIWPMKWTGLSTIDYQVPPNIDKLFFREYDEGDGPEIGRIEVFNPTSTPVLIPGGWVVGGDLLQVRAFDSSALVAPMQSIVANVSCVERGRWGEGKTEVDGGRAPLSVHGSGRVFNRKSKVWTIDIETRQKSVWKRVSQLENLSGSRPTSSLQQIMSEDSTSLNIPTSLLNSSSQTLRTIDGQNGMIIAFDGAPLLLEAFSHEIALRETIQSTIRSISFDIDHLDFIPTSKESIKEFIKLASLGNLTASGRGTSNMNFLGGGQRVDANALSDAEGKLIHITALNRAHRLLQEV